MNAKELKKLATACRKAGITYYKCAEFEFTLGELPKTNKKLSPVKTKQINQGDLESHPEIDTEQFTQEQLLFWSSPIGDESGVPQ